MCSFLPACCMPIVHSFTTLLCVALCIYYCHSPTQPHLPATTLLLFSAQSLVPQPLPAPAMPAYLPLMPVLPLPPLLACLFTTLLRVGTVNITLSLPLLLRSQCLPGVMEFTPTTCPHLVPIHLILPSHTIPPAPTDLFPLFVGGLPACAILHSLPPNCPMLPHSTFCIRSYMMLPTIRFVCLGRYPLPVLFVVLLPTGKEAFIFCYSS